LAALIRVCDRFGLFWGVVIATLDFIESSFEKQRISEVDTYCSDVQKSVPVKLARLLLDITIGCCFDSHPRIDSVLQNSGFRYGLLENAIYEQAKS
jgi:hypothetical protein